MRHDQFKKFFHSVFIAVLGGTFTGCAMPPQGAEVSSPAGQAVTYVTPEVVRHMQKTGQGLLIDAGSVREPPTRVQGSVSMHEVDLNTLNFPIGSNVVFYNAGFGNKAARAAAAKFKRSGVNVAVMDGGLLAWIRAGYPVSERETNNVAPVGVTPTELQRAIRDEDKFLLIDLRQSDDFSVSRIEGARHVELDKIAAESTKWPKDRWIIFYDNVGKYSEEVADELRRKGFRYTGYLSGGYNLWLKESTTKSN